MERETLFVSALLLALGGACAPPVDSEPRNVLVVLLDDVSVADLPLYGIDPDVRADLTPHLDALAARGVTFRTAWANPFCSATRALVLTGRHASRTLIGTVVERGEVSLADDEVTLPEALARWGRPGAATAAFGKWHLEHRGSSADCPPTERHGFDAFAGTLGEVKRDYCDWTELARPPSLDAGGPSAEYMPAAVVDAAMRWIAAQEGSWFCYLAPQTPYHRLHVPPAELQGVVAGSACSLCEAGDARCYDAALQAFDTKLGELVASLGPDWEEHTTILFAADNGAPNNVLDYWPEGHGKGFLYEGGVRVPLVVAGRGVAPGLRGTWCEERVQLTDVYRTVTSLFGIEELPDDVAQDSLDLTPLLAGAAGARGRDVLVAEKFKRHRPAPPFPGHQAAARDERFKLIYGFEEARAQELYDLAADPREVVDLLADGAPAPGSVEHDALTRLEAAIHAALR
jgi:arylsulfatase A-like enzyme